MPGRGGLTVRRDRSDAALAGRVQQVHTGGGRRSRALADTNRFDRGSDREVENPTDDG
jgi:hypothetical protein